MEFHDILSFDAGKSCEKRRDAEIINEPIFILLFLSWKASPTTTTPTTANSTKVQILRHEENGSNNKETTKLDTVVFSNGDVQAKEEEGGKGYK